MIIHHNQKVNINSKNKIQGDLIISYLDFTHFLIYTTDNLKNWR